MTEAIQQGEHEEALTRDIMRQVTASVWCGASPEDALSALMCATAEVLLASVSDARERRTIRDMLPAMIEGHERGIAERAAFVAAMRTRRKNRR